jgi:hypothetical protein
MLNAIKRPAILCGQRRSRVTSAKTLRLIGTSVKAVKKEL